MLIKVEVEANISQEGRVPTGNAVEACIAQCVADAVEGSFDEYPPHLHSMLRLKAQRLNDELRNEQGHSEVRFSFGLPTELFPIEIGGLQLLVNLLAGDMFPTEMLGCKWDHVRVTSVELPPEFNEAARSHFRDNRAHSIDDLRGMFKLTSRRPMLAFSFKPRVGLTFEETRDITLGVLRAGFNIVELDARNLAPRLAPLSRWIDLGIKAAQTGSHVTAFAPNLSIPPPQLIDAVTGWVDQVSPYGPAVVKVDGGLDGLSSIQAIRKLEPKSNPIITCYPILRNQLATAIGSTTWVELLSLSGADVIYPGGRPTFPNERRPVWGSHAEDWVRASRIYDDIVARGWPTPTIAGGIHPGHLHACYELLGPKVAYFLGGAVALHPHSATEGAKLCVDVLEQAIELAADAEKAGEDHAHDLPKRLLQQVERARYPNTALNYYSPTNIFRRTATKNFAPATFYRRR